MEDAVKIVNDSLTCENIYENEHAHTAPLKVRVCNPEYVAGAKEELVGAEDSEEDHV